MSVYLAKGWPFTAFAHVQVYNVLSDDVLLIREEI